MEHCLAQQNPIRVCQRGDEAEEGPTITINATALTSSVNNHQIRIYCVIVCAMYESGPGEHSPISRMCANKRPKKNGMVRKICNKTNGVEEMANGKSLRIKETTTEINPIHHKKDIAPWLVQRVIDATPADSRL